MALGFGYDMPIEEQIERCAKIGWDGVFTGWSDNNPDWNKLVRKTCDANGMFLQSIHLPYIGVDKLWIEGEKADKELAKALADFIELRETLRAVNSAKAIKELLRRLDELSQKDRTMKLLLIRQSIANSWKSVFPLKGTQQPIQPPAAPSPPRRSHIEIIDGEEVTVFDR